MALLPVGPVQDHRIGGDRVSSATSRRIYLMSGIGEDMDEEMVVVAGV